MQRLGYEPDYKPNSQKLNEERSDDVGIVPTPVNAYYRELRKA